MFNRRKPAEKGKEMITKKERQQIDRALDQLNKAIDWINTDRVHICIESSGTTTTEYKAINSKLWNKPEHLHPVTKFYGSELCGVLNAKQTLERMLENMDLKKARGEL